MTSNSEWVRLRAKVLVPKGPSMRRYRRLLRQPEPRAFRGIVSRPDRLLLIRAGHGARQRHANVMDPFRLPTYRHPQARKLERIARREAASIGWRIEFDADGVMYHNVG